MAAESLPEHSSIARNKRARHDYHILDRWEAGIVLTGTEVKSLRNGKANLTDAYGIVKDGELFLLNLHIAPYLQEPFHHDPRAPGSAAHRQRSAAIGSVDSGLTLIPLELLQDGSQVEIASSSSSCSTADDDARRNFC